MNIMLLSWNILPKMMGRLATNGGCKCWMWGMVHPGKLYFVPRKVLTIFVYLLCLEIRLVEPECRFWETLPVHAQ